MRLAGASLVVMVGALVLFAPSVDGSAARTLLRLARSSTASVTARPFDHSRHESLLCKECHGTGEQHRTLLVRTARDCASCHHDERRGFACRTCHASGDLPEQREVTTTVIVRDSARARVLPFGHERHARVVCTECHQTPVTLQLSRDCRSCHARHEQRDANCASCHAGDGKTTHNAEAHLSCAAAGCHASSAQFSVAAPRNTCLACHAEQRTHEPAGECAACHQIPADAVRDTAPRGDRP